MPADKESTIAMLRPWSVYPAIVLCLLGLGALGAGPEEAPPDPAEPVDLVEESVVAGAGIGPDVIVGKLDGVSNWGSVGGISAYSVGTVSCNIGDVWLRWCTSSNMPATDCFTTNQHPVIGQNMYRLKSDRFEQIGQSWLKHGFFALSEGLCFTNCQPVSGGHHLGVHCSDPYTASLNGNQSILGPKFQVNAHTGEFPYPPYNPSFSGAIARRLQVKNSDLDPSMNAGALYFVEGQYVTQDDAAAGNGNNNASYRRVSVVTGGTCSPGQYCLTLPGAYTTQREQSAIRAWKDTNDSICADKVCAGGTNDGKACLQPSDCPTPGVCAEKVCAGGVNDGQACALPSDCPSPGVCAEKVCVGGSRAGEACVFTAECEPIVETDVQVPGEGLFILSARATDLGTGMWHYEYALQNLNSDRSGGSFTVPIPDGVSIPPESIGFHDVDYHSGDGVGCPGCVCAGGSRAGLVCTSNGDCPSSACSGSHINFDGTDWPTTVDIGKITWATTPYSVDPNANALRWSTLYNFRFDANVGPAETTVTLGLFKPGSPSEVAIQTIGPMVGLIDCNGNGIADSCDVDCNALGCTPPCGPRCTGGSRNGLACSAHSECPKGLCGGLDCDGNNVPDECEVDCNNNDIPDVCDIRDCPPDDLRCADCQPNDVPDECEVPPLCPTCPDCEEDGIPDACDHPRDCDGDGIEDCDDLCLCTTPVGACLPPFNQRVICCFPNSTYSDLFTWGQCLSVGGTPVCDDPIICPGTPCPETSCRGGCLVGDFDRDGDLDLYDFGALQSCFSASVGNPAYVAPSAECQLRFDFDGDLDVDLQDLEAFLGAYTGP